MNDNKKKEVLDFIIKCSTNEKVMCDWFEMKDGIDISNVDLSIAINELKKENRIKASEGEYLPKTKLNEKEKND